ncbi:VanZ family protein [Pleurocapsa sp. CCALA 161]|uniref:VanZ family protein n=1 Tax=Pleurocapsa sp. CCALA 161 TaxID=2107688 RepID=UPI000D05F741|nr:VanZ family protein [Pleurocapsa sp. CCALA 161]PSB09231.1 VanZ family protein [Pleurocapsa sp. CCALA 161]
MNIKKSPRWGNLLFIASLAAIVIATISPFNFQIPPGFSGQFILQKFEFGGSVKDYWQNILLFIPLGISLAMIGDRQGLSTPAIVAIACLASILTTSAVETTQLFLSSRVSNLSDIICNSLGGTLGAIFYFWRKYLAQFLLGLIYQDTNRLSLKSLLIAIASYCALVTLMVLVLLANVNLSNWDDYYYLGIGNEVTGDRPWNGRINNLYISDRGFNPAQVQQAFTEADTLFAQSPDLVTFLKFTDEEANSYQDRSHHLPNLLWQNVSASNSQAQKRSLKKQQSSENNGILVNSRQWLKTAKPAAALTQKLQHTGEFSLYLAVSSNNPHQSGPARIMSLSYGTINHNLVIAQEGKDLQFRLRTPITGSAASQPRFRIPRIFANDDLCRLLVVFADKKLDFYVNNAATKYSFEFTPATSFFSYIPWSRVDWIVNLEGFKPLKYQLLFYTIIITPLIILGAYLVFYQQRFKGDSYKL